MGQQGEDMILRVTEYNNGYGCQCCARGWSGNDWIKDNELMTGEQLIAFIDNQHEKLCDDHVVTISYEKDGKKLYGFDSRVYKVGEDAYITIGDEKHLYRSDVDKYKINEIERKKLIDLINSTRGKICH
jgi:hypothetical protein